MAGVSPMSGGAASPLNRPTFPTINVGWISQRRHPTMLDNSKAPSDDV
ncbi:hypothetical protein [uncultured Pseudoalteromonas sp.]|nr:hypothetical protein [uncultured Pseudoalteromonas sp.]